MAKTPPPSHPLIHERRAPAHLRGMHGDQLWAEFRRNGKDLWCAWDCDEDYGIDISAIAAAEIIEEVEALGGTIEINLDVHLPPGCPMEPEDMDREYIQACGPLLKELLRFQRESQHNLEEVADQ